MPPLSLVESSLRFDDLPSLSNMNSEGDEEDEQQEQLDLEPHATLALTLQSLRRSTRRQCHTSTTHHQGRAMVSSSDNDDDNDDGDLGVATSGSRTVGGDDVDWEGIQDNEE